MLQIGRMTGLAFVKNKAISGRTAWAVVVTGCLCSDSICLAIVSCNLLPLKYTKIQSPVNAIGLSQEPLV